MKFENELTSTLFKKTSYLRMTAECLAFTLIALSFAYWYTGNHLIPLTGAKFPWIFLIPMFCALYFNLSLGLLVYLIVVSFLVLFNPTVNVADSFMQEFYVGGGLLTFLSGIFSASWQRRLKHVEYLNNYLFNHMDNLSKDYFLLKLSHERLEHSYITKPLSFREAIYSLKNQLGNHGILINQETGIKFLTILSQYCLISNASLVLIDQERSIHQRIASLGPEFEVDEKDPLIEEVINRKTTSYFAVNQISFTRKTKYLAVIPLIQDKGLIIGYTVIKDMPFWLLNEENLEVLTVFSSVLMMNTLNYAKLSNFFNHFPLVRRSFLLELHQLRRLKKYNKIDSVLAALVVPTIAQQKELIYGMQHSKRAMDHLCVVPETDYELILILLPLTSMPGAFSYQRRLKDWVQKEFGLIINENGLFFRYHMLNEERAGVQLQQFMEQIHDELH